MNTIALKLEAAGKAHLLAWIGDETPWQNTILLAGTRIDTERPQLVVAFLRAYKRGAHDYNDAFTGPDNKRHDGPAAAEVLAIIARHLHQPAAQLQQGISYVDPEQRLDIADVERQVRLVQVAKHAAGKRRRGRDARSPVPSAARSEVMAIPWRSA
ncbi:MAG: hypothetical protein ACREFQ_21785 [Stellaceae bacterium]